MGIKDALQLAREKALALNPATITFTRRAQVLNAQTGGMTNTTSTRSISARIVRPYYTVPDEMATQMGGNSVKADWLVIFGTSDADVAIGDRFVHPLTSGNCEIVATDIRAAEGEAATLLALATEVKP